MKALRSTWYRPTWRAKPPIETPRQRNHMTERCTPSTNGRTLYKWQADRWMAERLTDSQETAPSST